jgi:endo-1,4-beta-xylanase
VPLTPSALCSNRAPMRLATAAALAALLTAAAPASAASLKTVSHRTGIAVGAALPTAMTREQRSDVLRNFSAITTENAFKWEEMSPTRGRTRFADTDRVVAWANRHHLRLRAHNLFWHRLQLPAWVPAAVESAKRPRALLRSLMQRRVEKVVSRYAGRVDIWDVVNEPLAVLGAGWDTENGPFSVRNLFYLTLGERYIDAAFRWTRRADPHGQLFLNELVWNPVLGDPKADALLALVRRLKRRGVPIDGVGLQTHGMLGVEPPWYPPSASAFARYMRALARLGVKVEITELDVALPLVQGSNRLAGQAALYRRAAAACGRVRACTGLSVWGLRDPDSWLDIYDVTKGNAPNRPLLLDGAGRPKPAYRAVAAGLMLRLGARSGSIGRE